MALIQNNILVSWVWDGDNELLAGFNIALCYAPNTPLTSTLQLITVTDPSTRSFQFTGVIAETQMEINAFVQTLYIGGDSPWVETGSVLTIPDDGVSTILIQQDIQDFQTLVNQSTDDHWLNKSEKSALRISWDNLYQQYVNLVVRCQDLIALAGAGTYLDTALANYSTAFQNLGSYLNNNTTIKFLIPAWTIGPIPPISLIDTNLSTITFIDTPSDFRNYFSLYSAAKEDLSGKMTGIAATLANWQSVAGAPISFLSSPPISGSGLYATSNYTGFFSSGSWKTYLDNSGNFYLNGTGVGSQGLQWNSGSSALTIDGNVTARAGYIGDKTNGWLIGSTGIMNKRSGLLTYAGGPTITGGGTYIGTDGISLGPTVATPEVLITVDGNLSLGNKLVWNGSSLAITGAIVATSGSFTGSITSSSGFIGGWTIGASSLYNNKIALTDTTAGIYIGTDGISAGSSGQPAFKITSAGILTCSSATITGAITATSGTFSGTIQASSGYIGTSSGWTIDTNKLYNGTRTTLNTSGSGIYIGTDGIGIGSGGALANNFYVTSSGNLYAWSANITGNITATSGTFTGSITSSSGTIGGWTIGGSSLSNNKATFSTAGTGFYIGTDGIAIGDGFSATNAGIVKLGNYASGSNYIYWNGTTLAIKGDITLSSGSSISWSQVAGTGRPADNAGVIIDTRSVNGGPSTYAVGTTDEFKYRSVVGAPGSATYGGLRTIKPWTDNSGGNATQYFYSADGTYKRTGGCGDTSWGAWITSFDNINPPGWTNISGRPNTTYIGSDGIYTGTLIAENITGTAITGKTLQTSATGERFVVDLSTNKAYFYGDRGDGVIESVATIGTTTANGSTAFAVFGSISTAANKYGLLAFGGGSQTAVRASSGSGIGVNATTSALAGTAILGTNNSVDGSSGVQTAGIKGSSIGAGISGTGKWGVYGTTNTSLSDACGIYGYAAYSIGIGVKGEGGYSSATWSVGVSGNGYNYDFYATGSGANYGPFTGSHEGFIEKSVQLPEVGDILVDVKVINKSSISQTITEVNLSNTAKQKAVVGAYVSSRVFDQDNVPPSLKLFYPDSDIPNYDLISETYNIITFNSLGEGQVNVCKDGGNIEIGDYICSSNRPGKGMKQDDDLLHNYTVAKAREACIWADGEDDIRMIACTYHCA